MALEESEKKMPNEPAPLLSSSPRAPHPHTHAPSCTYLLTFRILSLICCEISLAIYFFTVRPGLYLSPTAGQIARVYNGFNIIRRWTDERCCGTSSLPLGSQLRHASRSLRGSEMARWVFLVFELALARYMVPDFWALTTPKVVERISGTLWVGLFGACFAALFQVLAAVCAFRINDYGNDGATTQILDVDLEGQDSDADDGPW